MHQITENNKKT